MCPSAQWELDAARFFGRRSCVYLGKLREVSERVPDLVREAEHRGNLFAANGSRSGFTNLAWLVHGEVAEARFEVGEARRTWNHQGFHIQHFHYAMAQSNINLCVGAPERAYEIVRDLLPRFEESLASMTQQQRVDITYLHARLALATDRVSEAEKDARSLSRESAPWGVALGLLLTAGIVAKSGTDRAIADALDTAIVALDACDLRLHGTMARYRRGAVGNDEASTRARAIAETWMAEERVADPGRFATVMLPGFDARRVASST